ncbi:hypothetical protein RG963_12720 [Methanosarcina sp. Z-7115]|uniref:GAF domain-containing protein n=1 Tax=Methanosarcina baikalica TaxID=3073890 RepID=A0ABU2D3T0_9EURY|nr:hypothetical protein [Methanosarcina sp. Z-7115]MDR7666623.1 hypothetical protein [Methanosarcina sp. Z-7115]
MGKETEIIKKDGFVFTDKVTEEVTNIKYTIKKFLELFRKVFGADACYLYLINKEMDPDEKREILEIRIKEMKEAYEKFKESNPSNDYDKTGKYPEEKAIVFDKLGTIKTEEHLELIIPDQLCIPTQTDDKSGNRIESEISEFIEILKFIDVSQEKKNDGKDYWNYDPGNRPQKYVIFKKYKDKTDIPENSMIYNEGITSFIYRTKYSLKSSKKDLNVNKASASLNSKHNIKPPTEMSIGFPLLYKEKAIGVLTFEFYDPSKNYNDDDFVSKTEFRNACKSINEYIPLFVQLIHTSQSQFSRGSYETLFGGEGLLNCLKKMKCPPKDSINGKIYIDTLHLFYVLKRKEYVGYNEILDRVARYINNISTYFGLTSKSKPFTDFLDKFKKHEELLLDGLNDYRDHFMHEFHVFVSGYIIINLIEFDFFQTQIQKSMILALGKSQKQLKIPEFNVLRIWFLISFFHDHAYIFEKIGPELEIFFKDVFNQEFVVNFNWEQLLKKESNFPKHLTDLQSFFNKHGDTNPDVLMRNYLDAILYSHDHGVLSALLVLNYFSDYKSISSEYGSIKDDCLYAAFAISIHNRYENLMEKEMTRISFESFPLAFLLSYCDTAQSFGRIGKKETYRSRFSDIKLDKKSDKRIIYEIDYLDENEGNIPPSYTIEGWAKQAHNTFKSSKYFFEIENYVGSSKKHIYKLPYGYYRDIPKRETLKKKTPKTEAPKTETPKTEAPKTETPKTEKTN